MSLRSKAKRAEKRADKRRAQDARLKNDLRAMRDGKLKTDGMNTRRKVKQGRVHMQETAHGKLHDGRKLKNLLNNPFGRIGKDYPLAETKYGQHMESYELSADGEPMMQHSKITADVVARSKPLLREAFGDCTRDLNMSRVHRKGEELEKDTRSARERHDRAYANEDY